MDRSTLAQALLSEAAEHLGLPDLALDADRAAVLGVEGGGIVDITLDAPGRTLLLSSAIGRPPEGGEAVLFRRLLAVNALPQQTDNLVMSLDAATGEVGQSRRVLLEDLDLSGLLAELDRFIRQREAWAAALAAPRSDDRSDPPPAAGEQVIWL